MKRCYVEHLKLNKMTYNEAYNKIIDAYFKDEIKPFDAQFCFCGTLCDSSADWHIYSHEIITKARHNDFNGYTGHQFVMMEHALLEHVRCIGPGNVRYEEKLFNGMCDALGVLKEIHRERGEDVDAMPALTKRKLAIQ